jgi:hypothetical protein
VVSKLISKQSFIPTPEYFSIYGPKRMLLRHTTNSFYETDSHVAWNKKFIDEYAESEQN